jgi:hypothetical protein
MEERKRGERPAKERKMREFPLYVYLPSEEAVALIKEAAERARPGEGVSAWARAVLMGEARRILDRPE